MAFCVGPVVEVYCHMQSLCLRHTYLFSHLFAIPPTCFPLIVVPSLPPPCPCRIHTLRRVGVLGLHQGVCPIPPPRGMPPGCLPPPPGDAASVFVPSYPPGGCRQGVCPILPPPPPPAASPIAPFDAPLRPVDAVICAAAPPPPPTALAHTCFQSLVVGGTSPLHPLPTTTCLWRPTIPSTRLRAH